MPSYVVDSQKQPMTATGIVEMAREWEEGADGRRRPSEKQARNENTGMPLWAVEVIYVQTTYGRKATVTAKVTVDSMDEPKPSPLTPVTFGGLVVEVRVTKAGGLIESWSAESVDTGARAAARATSDKAA
ncbi:MAG: hypothetical protein ACRCSN_09890 [Dermatophilaceae bacterium]